jgi:hypothetical protein
VVLRLPHLCCRSRSSWRTCRSSQLLQVRAQQHLPLLPLLAEHARHPQARLQAMRRQHPLLHPLAGPAGHPAARLQMKTQQHLWVLLLAAGPAGHLPARLQSRRALHKQGISPACGRLARLQAVHGEGGRLPITLRLMQDVVTHSRKRADSDSESQGGASWWWMLDAPCCGVTG